jgi:hypothetical protein
MLRAAASKLTSTAFQHALAAAQPSPRLLTGATLHKCAFDMVLARGARQHQVLRHTAPIDSLQRSNHIMLVSHVNTRSMCVGCSADVPGVSIWFQCEGPAELGGIPRCESSAATSFDAESCSTLVQTARHDHMA